MEDTKQNEGEKVVTSATKEDAKVESDKTQDQADVHSQDPVKEELQKVKGKKYSESEQAAYKLKMLAKRASELGLNPLEILKETKAQVTIDADDDAPITVGMLREMQKQEASSTAKSLAESEIQDESERELVIHYLENTIKSSGNPKEDLITARRLANSVKTERILADQVRKAQPHSASSASGAPAKLEKDFIPTPNEALLMRPPFNLTKDQVIAARKQAERDQK